jgi:RNA polymerase sigma-70 factor (ECF subfamily)
VRGRVREEQTVQPDPDSEAAIATDLARRIRAGDRKAEEELVRRYSRGLLVHLRRMTGDPALSDDLHQETFRVVLERLRREELEEPGRLAAFVLRTGRNLFLGAWRKRTRRGEGTSLDGLNRLDREPEPEVADPTPGQLATVLREEERERICTDLGLTGQHFNRVLFRARQRLKELLHDSR